MRSILVLAVLVLPGCMDALAQTPEDALPDALLRDTYPRLILEIDHAASTPPCPAALASLYAALLTLTDKLDVRLAGPTEFPDQGGSYSNADLVRIDARTTDHGPVAAGVYGVGDTAHLHVVYLDGMPGSPKTGHAAGRTLHDQAALFVFPDAFADVHQGQGEVRRDVSCDIERTVLLHELGHAFGLVNRGIPMLTDREAADHAGHSTNPESVMYPVLHIHEGRLLRPLPPGFDAADLADLAAFRAT